MIYLFRTFGIEWREKLDSWSIVFQERFIQICASQIPRSAVIYQVSETTIKLAMVSSTR
jgi:hypothetical protein